MTDYRNAWKEGDSVNILSGLSDSIVLFRLGKKRASIKGKSDL